MQSKLVLYLGLLFYTSVVATGAVLFDYQQLVSTAVLLLVPVIWWWHELYPSRLFIYSTLALAVSSTFLFEVIAHTSGIWYSVSSFDWRLFGLFPLEVLFFSTVLFFYVIFLHEWLVDDKKMHRAVFNTKKFWLLFFAFTTALAAIVYAILFATAVLPYGFLWILIGLTVTLVFAILLAHKNPKQVLEKVLHTTLLMLPIFLIVEAVAILNVDTVYANPTQYLYSVSFLGEIIPIEKIFYLILAPTWILTIYELYFDDAK